MWADLGPLQTKTVPETPLVLINFLFEVSSHNFVSENSVPSPNFTRRELGIADKPLALVSLDKPSGSCSPWLL